MKRTLTCAVAFVAGCLLFLAPAPAPCAEQAVEHAIRSGDNLHLIAGYYYGNPREWKKIWRTNRKSIAGPNRLTPGRLLLVEGSTGKVWPGSYDDFRSRVRGQ